MHFKNCFEQCDDEGHDIFEQLGTSAKIIGMMTSSKIPKTGLFHASIWKEIINVNLSSDVLMNEIEDKCEYRRFNDKGMATIMSILEKTNPHCCLAIKKNRIKKVGSRKINIRFWSGRAVCTFTTWKCFAELNIQNQQNPVLEIIWKNNISHNIAEMKKRKLTGQKRSDFHAKFKASDTAPSKTVRQRLASLSSESYSSGKREVTQTTLSQIKYEASQQSSSEDLLTNLNDLRRKIKDEDETQAVKVAQQNRTFFGYIQHCNISKDVNIVLTREGLIRWMHETAKRDYFFIDATGSLFKRVTGYAKLLYYALVVRHPFAKHIPLPIAEYITSKHTADSISFFLRTIRQLEKDIYGVQAISSPTGVLCDFSFPFIMAILDTYNNQTLLTFLDIVFKAVSTEDGEIPKVTYPRICAGHMMHLISKWASKLSKKDASSASSVHLAKRLFGRLIQSESLEDMTRLVIDATIVFCSTKITDEVKAALERLTQAVNTFKPANLLCSITEGHENYPCEDENDNENCDENCNGSELPRELSNQLKNCLFMKHWNSIVSKAKDELSSSKSAKDLLDNKYFFPSFLDHIHSNYLQFCPLWSKIAFSRATDDFETKRFDKVGCRTIKSSAY